VRGVLIFVLVIGAIVGLLLTLRTSRNAGMPGPEVMDRASKRAREQAASEKDE
jgi:hypothetical protein